MNRSCMVQARTVHEKMKTSEIISCEFYKIGFDVSGADIDLSPSPAEAYKGDGLNSLVNLKIGGENFRIGWMGFQSDTVNVDLQLNEELEVSSVGLHLLELQGAWIFLPREIRIYSNDKLLGEWESEVLEKVDVGGDRFIKIDLGREKTANLLVQVIAYDTLPNWHPGAGAKPWLFMDEILIN